MSKRSYLWRQAQICLSRARATGDPSLKELYEDMIFPGFGSFDALKVLLVGGIMSKIDGHKNLLIAGV